VSDAEAPDVVEPVEADADLFGEPSRTGTLSQFFTPAWLARRAVRWIDPRGARVLEPSAGRGNLIEAYIREHGRTGAANGDRIEACEVDPRWAAFLRERFGWLAVHDGDFLAIAATFAGRGFNLGLCNPPYESGQDAEHVARLLEITGDVITIVKSDFEYSAARDRVLWQRARVVQRGLCIDRPDFGKVREKKKQGPERNFVALRIVPAEDVGGAYDVVEERWRRKESGS